MAGNKWRPLYECYDSITVKTFLTLTALAFGLVSNAAAAVDCDLLVGSWRSERFDQTLQTNRTAVSTFYADGRYYAKFAHENRHHEDTSSNSGNWRCAGDKLTVNITATDHVPDDDLHVYTILELTAKTLVIEVFQADCSRIDGDCAGVVFDLTRVR